jgi:hypothetical protein
MKKSTLLYAAILLLAACHPSDNKKEEIRPRVSAADESPEASTKEKSVESAVYANSTSSGATASFDLKSNSNANSIKVVQSNVIRTADMKFRVENVNLAAQQLEKITSHFGGVVSHQELGQEQDAVINKAISEDSSLELIYYTVVDRMTLMIPNIYLDSALNKMESLIDFLDHKTIDAADVSLQITENELTISRNKIELDRMRISLDSKGRKLQEITDGSYYINGLAQQIDQAQIASQSLKQQVKYSTVNLSIYQRKAIQRKLIANIDSPEQYEAGVGSKMWNSIKVGWYTVLLVIEYILRFWALILFAIIGYVAYKKWGKNFLTKEPLQAVPMQEGV